jgi:hypothetical protein
MSRFDTRELVFYLAGWTDDERRRDIESHALADQELSARLQLLANFSGLGRKQVARRSWRQQHRLIAAIGVVVILAGVCGATCIALTPRALLYDGFSDGWFDSQLWLPPGVFSEQMGVQERGGFLKLINRGYLVTRGEFDAPLEISFDWSWSELGNNPLYADHLAVAVRTSGDPLRDYPHEVRDGVVIKFNAWTGTVEVWEQPSGSHRASTKKGLVKLPAETWHHVRITDDGEQISVYVSAEEGTDQDSDEPVLVADCPAGARKRHIAFYNRELVADIPHESWIDNIVIRRLANQ